MTFIFPDVSEYTPNVDPSQYPVLIARATLSDRVTDPTYAMFKAKAAAAGAVFLAYHWLNHGNLAAQAAHCFSVVGPGVPVMIDAEDVAGNTGYAGPLTVDDLLGFAAAYRALGGTVSLCYLPFWYWAGPMSAPHRLGELATAGLGLVSSNYTTYTDTGPGWAAYYAGAPIPVQWQYTSTPIDMNAFRGTVAEFAALTGGKMALTDTQWDDLYRRVCNLDSFVYYGLTLGQATIPASQLSYDLPPNNHAPAQDQAFALNQKLGALTAPTGPTQDQVDAAVAKVMTDPAWLAGLGAALAAHLHVS